MTENSAWVSQREKLWGSRIISTDTTNSYIGEVKVYDGEGNLKNIIPARKVIEHHQDNYDEAVSFFNRTDDRIDRVCANHECKKAFRTKDRRKIFCITACARSFHAKKQNSAAKLRKQGKRFLKCG